MLRDYQVRACVALGALTLQRDSSSRLSRNIADVPVTSVEPKGSEYIREYGSQYMASGYTCIALAYMSIILV